MRKAAFLSALVFFVFTSLSAQTCKKINHLLKVKDKVGFSENQVTELKDIKYSLEMYCIKKESELKLAELELKRLMENRKENLDLIRRKIEEISRIKGELKFSEIENDIKISDIYTAEQKSKCSECHLNAKKEKEEKMKQEAEMKKHMEMMRHMEKETEKKEQKHEGMQEHMQMMKEGQMGNITAQKKSLTAGSSEKMKNLKMGIGEKEEKVAAEEVITDVEFVKEPCEECASKIREAVKKHLAECEDGKDQVCPEALKKITEEIMDACYVCNGDDTYDNSGKTEECTGNCAGCGIEKSTTALKEVNIVELASVELCADCAVKIKEAIKKHLTECDDGKSEICPDCLEQIKTQVIQNCPVCNNLPNPEKQN